MRIAMALSMALMVPACLVDSNDEPAFSEIDQTVLTCSDTILGVLQAEPTGVADEVFTLKCNANLPFNARITKRIKIEDSNITLNCNESTLDPRGFAWYSEGNDVIEIVSKHINGVWTRPENVHVNRCKVEGSVRTWGMCRNGQDCDQQLVSSTMPGHTERARERAPRNIFFDGMTITAHSRTPFHIAPGVTYASLTNSYLGGSSLKSAIYLDAESGYNTIKDNEFHVVTDSDGDNECLDADLFENPNRCAPVISIDGSSNNKIVSNYITGANKGGIHLYRNCGEPAAEGAAGTVRWNTPSYNSIINNVFYYNSYSGNNYAIFIGARGPGTASYCGADSYSPYGSGSDDRDLATNNIVAQNQFYRRSVAQSIRIGPLSGDTSSNSPNFIDPSNVGGVTTHVIREAGCYMGDGYPNALTVDGGLVDMRHTNGRPYCSTPYSCNDGRLTQTTSSCTITNKPFGCSISGSNAGCQSTVACTGTGARIVGAVAACNLEFGSVTPSYLAALAGNTIGVEVPSGVVSDGECKVAVSSRSSGVGPLTGVFNQTQLQANCKEHDDNGGDCSLLGTVYCRTQTQK